ncbi:MAG: cytochrome bc1 complex cytochrome b subunit [Mycobacteriales bacterium]
MAETRTGAAGVSAAKFVDERLNTSSGIRRQLNKVFPDHWSFLFGEVALYSFIILLLTGTYLALFFRDSLAPVIYNGSYLPLRGVTVSEAFASTLRISFDIRAGLVIRQIHHWAADLFVAAIVLHLCRVFFTGAFRKPREINWLIGVGLLTLAIVEGFAGYSLPGDLLSGEGLRITYSIALSIPVVGTWVAYLLFGGPYPGTDIEGRLYVAHILLIPGVLLALISAHLAIVWHQKHTQFPGPGRTEKNVVGERMFPVYAAKGGGFFFIVSGILALLGGLAQINPVWLYGPYNTYDASAGSQPDWYMGFLDGALRLMPNWEFRGLGYDIPFNVFLPAAVLPGILFTLLALYPFLEARFTGDRGYHNLLQRPREAPTRTALGVMSLTFYTILLAASSSDVMAFIFHLSQNLLIWIGRVTLIVLPPIMYKATKLYCIALNNRDREFREHGFETGIVRMSPTGEFTEVHAPLPQEEVPALVDVEEHPAITLGGHEPAAVPALADAAGSPPNGHGNGNGRALVSSAARGLAGFFVRRSDQD